MLRIVLVALLFLGCDLVTDKESSPSHEIKSGTWEAFTKDSIYYVARGITIQLSINPTTIETRLYDSSGCLIVQGAGQYTNTDYALVTKLYTVKWRSGCHGVWSNPEAVADRSSGFSFWNKARDTIQINLPFFPEDFPKEHNRFYFYKFLR